ncbi:hypothetical protein KSP40_PGU009904 [Platanthera guangdongensis]|uniref:CCHC-type domain-containing protein n=1 Tax=Platanthera guangdongensis TaxID=2320717 RepID=A0ABR2LK46_9ASPA
MKSITSHSGTYRLNGCVSSSARNLALIPLTQDISIGDRQSFAVRCSETMGCDDRATTASKDISGLVTVRALGSKRLWEHALGVGGTEESVAEDTWLTRRCALTNPVFGRRRGVGEGHNTTDLIGLSGSLSAGVTIGGSDTKDRSLAGLSTSLGREQSISGAHTAETLRIVGILGYDPETSFQTKDLINLQYFLGLVVARRPDGLILSQQKYCLAGDIVTSCNMHAVVDNCLKSMESVNLTAKPYMDKAHTIKMDENSDCIRKREHEDIFPVKKPKLDGKFKTLPGGNQSTLSSLKDSPVFSRKNMSGCVRYAKQKEAEAPDIMSIIQECSRTEIKLAGDKKSSSCGLRVKKIMRRIGDKRETAILAQEIGKEIREVVKNKASKEVGRNDIDEKLLEAFRATMVRPKAELTSRSEHVHLGSMKYLVKGKKRENLTKRIYGTSSGRRRHAWARDMEIEFWKHRCSRTQHEKVETLQSVLELLKKATNPNWNSYTKRDSQEESTNSILSRVYIADASVFPRKDDIKPLSALSGSSHRADYNLDKEKSSMIVAIGPLNDNRSINKNPIQVSRNSVQLKANSADSISLSINAAENITNSKVHSFPSDARSDKRKWALEVLARKTSSANMNANKGQEKGSLLKGNYPLLAQLPQDMRPMLASTIHNKVSRSIRQNLRQGTLTVAEYMTCFDELIVRSDILDEPIATSSRFKAGLRSDIQRELIPHRLETVDQIFQLSLEYEKATLGYSPLCDDDNVAESGVQPAYFEGDPPEVAQVIYPPADFDMVQQAVQSMYSLPQEVDNIIFEKVEMSVTAKEAQKEAQLSKKRFREQAELKPDFEQWSPTFRNIILTAWKAVKDQTHERGKWYTEQEWNKYEARQEVILQYRRKAKAEKLLVNALEPSNNHSDEDFASFTRQFQRFLKKKQWRSKASSSQSKDEYYQKRKSSRKDKSRSKPSKSTTTKIVCYYCNRPVHVVADCPNKRNESADKKKSQSKNKKEKSFVAKKEKSWTDPSSSDSESDAEAYISLFATEEETKFLQLLNSINGTEDHQCKGLMVMTDEDHCQDQSGLSKVKSLSEDSDYYTDSESEASARDVDGFKSEADIHQLIDEYGDLLQAFKRCKNLTKIHAKEIAALKLTASDSEKLLDQKMNEIAKLKNITFIQMRTITFKSDQIKSLEVRLQKENDLVASFSKPKSVIPLIDDFVSQNGKAGLSFKGNTTTANFKRKRKAPVKPLVFNSPIAVRKVQQPTNRHGHGKPDILNDKVYPAFKQRNTVPTVLRTADSKAVKTVPKRGIKEKMNMLTIKEDQTAQLYRITEHYLRRANLPVIRRTAETELAVADAVNVEKEIFERSNSKLVYVNLCSQTVSQLANMQESDEPSIPDSSKMDRETGHKSEWTLKKSTESTKMDTETDHMSEWADTNIFGLTLPTLEMSNGACEDTNSDPEAPEQSIIEKALRMAGLFSDSPPSSPDCATKDSNEDECANENVTESLNYDAEELRIDNCLPATVPQTGIFVSLSIEECEGGTKEAVVSQMSEDSKISLCLSSWTEKVSALPSSQQQETDLQIDLACAGKNHYDLAIAGKNDTSYLFELLHLKLELLLQASAKEEDEVQLSFPKAHIFVLDSAFSIAPINGYFDPWAPLNIASTSPISLIPNIATLLPLSGFFNMHVSIEGENHSDLAIACNNGNNLFQLPDAAARKSVISASSSSESKLSKLAGAGENDTSYLFELLDLKLEFLIQGSAKEEDEVQLSFPKAHLFVLNSAFSIAPINDYFDPWAPLNLTANRPASTMSLALKVEAYIKEHIRPLCKSGVITDAQYRCAVGKTLVKVMKFHHKAKNANFLIREGASVKKLAEQYVKVAQKK